MLQKKIKEIKQQKRSPSVEVGEWVSRFEIVQEFDVVVYRWSELMFSFSESVCVTVFNPSGRLIATNRFRLSEV